jgi:hypothetical protein
MTSTKGIPRPNSRGIRPHLWITGPDELAHEQYTAWCRSKAQAAFRGEGWTLTFAQFQKAWAGHWNRRGRTVHDLMLVRKNWKSSWNYKNIHLVDRKEFHQHQQAIKQQRKAVCDE